MNEDRRKAVGKVVGINVRRLRDEAGLNQKDFADLCRERKMPWSSARLSNVETANIPLNAVHELVSLWELFGELLDRPIALEEFFQNDPEPLETS